MEHRGVPAAEKYAELLALGQERPRCACHQETMTWNKDDRIDLKAGGYWVCAVRRRETSRHYGQNNPQVGRLYRETHPEKTRAGSRRWREANPEKVVAANAARIRVGGMYLGTFRFTQTEVEAMLSGTSD